jgi:peptide-methionine (S)-S-oxide reductase
MLGILKTSLILAEDYHQKYHLRQQRNLMQEFKGIYPQNDDFVNSTAAARVNGYLGGYGSPQELEAVIDQLGLSPAGRQFLLSMVKGRRR